MFFDGLLCLLHRQRSVSFFSGGDKLALLRAPRSVSLRRTTALSSQHLLPPQQDHHLLHSTSLQSISGNKKECHGDIFIDISLSSSYLLVNIWHLSSAIPQSTVVNRGSPLTKSCPPQPLRVPMQHQIQAPKAGIITKETRIENIQSSRRQR